MIRDSIEELMDLYREVTESLPHLPEGARHRAAITAVMAATYRRIFDDVVPPQSLHCGCGDIVKTRHKCETCETFDEMASQDE